MTYCWGIAGSAGMEAQVRALASVLDVDLHMKHLPVRPPFVWLPNACYAGPLASLVVPYALAPGHDAVRTPWPDMVISCGRRSAIAALGLRAHMRSPATKFIHIQDPHVHPSQFDLVIAMEHDRVQGGNVIKTHYAMHSLTKEKLNMAAAQWADPFSKYAKPYVAVLIGGSTNKYLLTRPRMLALLSRLQDLLKATAGTLLMTVSRRTGEENIRTLREILDYESKVYLYDGTGDNPYLGMLALADTIVVTNDSVNMMSEAAATGKPLYILELPGHRDTKPARFASRLVEEGIARVFTGTLEQWSYPPMDEMDTLAIRVKRQLNIP